MRLGLGLGLLVERTVYRSDTRYDTCLSPVMNVGRTYLHKTALLRTRARAGFKASGLWLDVFVGTRSQSSIQGGN